MDESVIISRITTKCKSIDSIEGAILLGSYGRGEQRPNSDLDIGLLVSEDVNMKLIFNEVIEHIKEDIECVLSPSEDKRVIFYNVDYKKLDLMIFDSLDNLKQFYQSVQNTEDIDKAIIFDNGGEIKKSILIDEVGRYPDTKIIEKEVEKFLEAFEIASKYANDSDVYSFYFNYNLALNRWVRIGSIQLGRLNNLYAPRNYFYNLKNNDRRAAERLAGSLYLSESQNLLINLAREFRKTYSQLCEKYSLKRTVNEINSIINHILRRDMMWNFRDISWLDKTIIKNGKLYRSSTLSRYEHLRDYEQMLLKCGIKQIIDLRFNYEKARYPYTNITKNICEVIEIPLHSLPEEKRVLNFEEDSIHLEFLDNKIVFKEIFNVLSKGKTTVVHCHSGKDRAGVVIALVEMVIGLPYHMIKKDFLASGMDITDSDAAILINNIEQIGGHETITKQFEIPSTDIEKIRRWLIKKQTALKCFKEP